MPTSKEISTTTEVFWSRRVCLTKLTKDKRPKARGLTAREKLPPRVGEPYWIFLDDKGLVLRTSVVKRIERTGDVTIFVTLNSIYHLQYVEEESLIAAV